MAAISDPSGMDDGFRVMDVDEFVRRFRRGVAHDDKTMVWLLGAGCSESSDVPGAAECARNWLKELKYLQDGTNQDVEAWAATRFVGFDPLNPAGVYGEVISALFHTENDLRRALERLLEAAEPGFGYATLAQLMTHPKWGSKSSLALSVNFDDLLADALHVYSQRRPQVVSQEALTAGTPLATGAPTVLKLHGDAHLPPSEETANRPRFREVVRERLREHLTETGLVIVGYGGREECVLDMLEGLPPGAPGGGVFWVNADRPEGAFADWLRRVGAVWVQHSDFDQLMYFMRMEFGLGHPKIDRFERVFRKYNAQYRELSTRSGRHIEPTPSVDGEAAPAMALRAPKRAPLAPGSGLQRLGTEDGSADGSIDGAAGGAEDPVQLDGLGQQAAKRETDQSRRERLRQSLKAYTTVLREATKRAPERKQGFQRRISDVNDLLDSAVIELHGGRMAVGDGTSGPAASGPTASTGGGEVMGPGVSTPSGRGPTPAQLGAVMGNGVGASTSRPGTRHERGQAEDEAENGPAVGDALARLAEDQNVDLPRREADGPGLRSATARAAAEAGPRQAAPAVRATDAKQKTADLARVGRMLTSGRARAGETRATIGDGGAELPPEPVRRLAVGQASFGEAAFTAAMEAEPRNAPLRARFARFMAVGVGDLQRAEAAFEEAHQLAPDDVTVLRAYAAFAFDHLRDAARAEKLLAQALHHDLRNPPTLRLLADFLTRAHGDLDEAENCLRLAIEVEPKSPQNYIEYARFLLRRRGRRSEAEAQLRKASELKPESAAALAELALFRAEHGQELDAAQQSLSQAERIAPGDADVAFARATISERKDELDDAEAHYRRAIEKAPGNVRARLAFAAFLERRRGDLDAAERLLRETMESAAHLAAPATAYGRFLASARGDRAAAEQTLRNAVSAEPFDADALAALAVQLAPNESDAEEVEDLFRDALALAPRSAQILRAYGAFLAERKGDLDGAEAQFRAAVEMDPLSADNHDAYAQFLHTMREDAEEAEVYYREALRLAPDRTETLNRITGFLRETKRDLDEAESFYRRALDANPRDAHALARSAQFLLSKGRRQEGLKVLNEAFDSAWRMESAVRPASLMLELWIYRYAHDPARREESLRAAIAQIESDVRCE
ncbi:MAG: tetratricopeptide repeat protein [Pseudomonadota bacterium]